MRVAKNLLLFLILVFLIACISFLSKKSVVVAKPCGVSIKDEASKYNISIENGENFIKFVSSYIQCGSDNKFHIAVYPGQQTPNTTESLEFVFIDDNFPEPTRVNTMYSKSDGTQSTKVKIMSWQYEHTEAKTRIYVWFSDDVLKSQTVSQEIPFYMAARLSFLAKYNDVPGQLDRISDPDKANLSFDEAGLKYE